MEQVDIMQICIVQRLNHCVLLIYSVYVYQVSSTHFGCQIHDNKASDLYLHSKWKVSNKQTDKLLKKIMKGDDKSGEEKFTQ